MSDTFFKCMYPFTHLSIGSNSIIKPCCRFFIPDEYSTDDLTCENPEEVFKNSKLFNDVRDSFSNKEFHEGCLKCVKEEKAGKTSFGRKYTELIGQITNSPQIQSAELSFSNNCNMKCVICSPNASSKWKKDWEELTGESTNIKNIEVPQNFIENIIFGDFIKFIKISGGEPFLQYKLLKLLKDFPTERAKRITLHINTNGTIYNKQIVKALKKFKKVQISISIDTVDKKLFNYSRPGVSWEVVWSNFKKFIELKSETIEIKSQCTISALNLHALKDLDSKIRRHDVEISYNVLEYPRVLSINTLPLEYREELKQYLDFLPIGVKSQIYTDQYPLFEDFFKYLEKLDQIRNTNIEEVLSKRIFHWKKKLL